MIDFIYSTEAMINASPQAIFDIVSNPSKHVELAGSGELNKVAQEPAGAVRTGTHLAAEETVRMADGSSKMSASSECPGPAAGGRKISFCLTMFRSLSTVIVIKQVCFFGCCSMISKV